MTDVEEYRLSLYEPIEILKESNEAKVQLVKNTLEDKKYIKISYHSDKREIFSKLMTIESECLPKIIELFWCEDTIVIEEYIEGEILSELLEKESIQKRNTLVIVNDILEAVEKLHEAGIVHRDIKPANIIIKENGHASIIDFGIAKIFSPNMKADTSAYGTIGYAPPEQYGFSQSDFKSDIYAIGITIKEIVQITNDKSLNSLIQKCTEFDPNKRPESIEKVRGLIRNKKLQPLIAVVFLACLAGCALFFWGILFNVRNNIVGKEDFSVVENTFADLMCFDESITDYGCLKVTESGIDTSVTLGTGLDNIPIKVEQVENEIIISIGDNFTKKLSYNTANSTQDYDNTSFYSEIVLYDLNGDGIYEIIPVIADARITNEEDATVLRNGMMAWCIGYDGQFYLAEGEIVTTIDPLIIYGTTPDCIWAEVSRCYRLEDKALVED